MKPSDRLKQLHIIMEGMEAKAYKCPAGVLTIGIGHTNPEIMPFNAKSEWSQEQIDQAWELDLKEAVDAANTYIKAPLSQGMFDATVDLIFNCGTGCKTYLKVVNAKYPEAGETELLKWIHVNGKAEVGLIKRRFADLALYKNLDCWEDIAKCPATSKDITPLNKLVAPLGYKVVPDNLRTWKVIQLSKQEAEE